MLREVYLEITDSFSKTKKDFIQNAFRKNLKNFIQMLQYHYFKC